MKLLFISRWFPYPPNNGSKIRIFNLIKHLSSYHEVTLISFASERVADEHLSVMRYYCQQVDVTCYHPFQPDRLRALMGYFSRRPRSVIDTYSFEMQKLINRAKDEQAFDAIVASQIDMAPYAMILPDTPKIFEEVELTTYYEQSMSQPNSLKKFRSQLMWWKLSHYVAGLLRQFDGCTVVSEGERERTLQLLPNYQSIGVVPNGVDTSHYAEITVEPEADTLIYSGALTYNANFDAMVFFLQEIFPLIQAERPGVRLYITGSTRGVPIDRLPNRDNVVFTGYLDDIRPAIARSWVSVAPLRIGGGTRLKILEAMAIGTPVVATGKGAEGLELKPEREILIADTPADFAAAVVRLLQDPQLRKMLSYNGRQVVEAKYDWQMIGKQLNDIIETAIIRRQGQKQQKVF